MIKEISGLNSYWACSDGYQINKKTKKRISGCVKRSGYVEVCLVADDGKHVTKLLHRLIAEAFCSKPLGCNEVNHIDGDKTNNSSDNLEWADRAISLKHAYVTGLRGNDVSPKRVKGVCLKTNKTYYFDSIYKASKQLGISQGNICMNCKGVRPYAGGYKWSYVA